ncbi:hypothetical protein ACLKA7_002457 [Drosophila subpalustris]
MCLRLVPSLYRTLSHTHPQLQSPETQPPTTTPTPLPLSTPQHNCSAVNFERQSNKRKPKERSSWRLFSIWWMWMWIARSIISATVQRALEAACRKAGARGGAGGGGGGGEGEGGKWMRKRALSNQHNVNICDSPKPKPLQKQY